MKRFCVQLLLEREATSPSSTRQSKQTTTPIGVDIGPIEVSREDGEMRSEEEEPLEADVSRERLKPKNLANRQKQEHDSGHATEVGVLLVSNIVESN